MLGTFILSVAHLDPPHARAAATVTVTVPITAPTEYTASNITITISSTASTSDSHPTAGPITASTFTAIPAAAGGGGHRCGWLWIGHVWFGGVADSIFLVKRRQELNEWSESRSITHKKIPSSDAVDHKLGARDADATATEQSAQPEQP